MTSHDFDPGTLDWSAHLIPAVRRPMGDGMHLVDAIETIGRRIVENWHPQIVREVSSGRPRDSEMPDADTAFDAAGMPVARVHRVWEDEVRDILPPGRWQSIELKQQDEDRWRASHLIDPRTKERVPVGELRSRRGRDRSDPITYENWQAAYEMSRMATDFHLADVSSLEHVIRFLIEKHRDGTLQLIARDENDRHEQVPPSTWNGDHESRMRIIASCRLAGVDPNALPRHLLVDKASLTAALSSEVTQEWFVPALPADHPWFHEDDDREAPSAYRWPELEARVRRVLEPLLEVKEHENWRRADLDHVIRQIDGFGKAERSVVEQVRLTFLEEGLFAFLNDPGRPSPRGRAVTLAKSEVLELVKRHCPALLG